MNTLTASISDENLLNMHTVQRAKQLHVDFTPRRILVGKRFRSSFKWGKDLAVNSL